MDDEENVLPTYLPPMQNSVLVSVYGFCWSLLSVVILCLVQCVLLLICLKQTKIFITHTFIH